MNDKTALATETVVATPAILEGDASAEGLANNPSALRVAAGKVARHLLQSTEDYADPAVVAAKGPQDTKEDRPGPTWHRPKRPWRRLSPRNW